MKNSKKILAMSLVVAFTSLYVSCKNNEKKDTETEKLTEEMASEMESFVTLFENDYTKVSKISLAPGESQPTHEGEARVIYALTDYTIDWEEQGKKLGTKTWKKGEAHFHEAGKHSATNNGTSTAEWLVFTKKKAELPECGDNTIENDVNAVSPDFANVLLENTDFKFTEITLQTGESIPMHSDINRIIYSLSDYEIAYESDSKGKLNKQFTTGDIHWHEACQHALKNSGETLAKFIVVSYKKKNN
jgi:hypothetical protein